MFARNISRKKARLTNQKIRRRGQRVESHRLDVRMRSRAETRERNIKFARRLAKVVVISGMAAGLAYSAHKVYRLAFYENSDFALSDLLIESDGVLGFQRIAQEAGLREGVNLLSIDIESVRRRIGEMPQVKSVEVERKLPNSLHVWTRERFPVAWLECPSLGIRSRTSQRGFMVDEQGVVIPCEALLRRYLNLPVIRVRTLARVKPGAVIGSDEVLTALGLIAKNDELFLEEQVAIHEIEIKNGFSMKVYFNNDSEVIFGMEDIQEQLSDLKLILRHSNAKNRQVATLNLMVRKNIPVTYFNFPSDDSEILNLRSGDKSDSSSTPVGDGDDRLRSIRAILGRG
ncbi:MAG: cell division protein FtsQ/DivIB [Verrucomicrobiales bacterium]